MFCLRDASAGDAHLLCEPCAGHAESFANRAQPPFGRRFEARVAGRSVIDNGAVLLPDGCFDAHLSTHMIAHSPNSILLYIRNAIILYINIDTMSNILRDKYTV